MLPKANRLILSKKNPSKLTKRIAGSGFTVAYSQTDGIFKAAVVVSKKTAKKAVDRNRIKRTISEALKAQKLQNLELLVVVRENIASLKTEEVKKRLEATIKSLKILK